MKMKKIRTTMIMSVVTAAFLMPSATFAYAQETDRPTTVAYDENSDTETDAEQSDDTQIPEATEATEEQTGTPEGQDSGDGDPDTESDVQELDMIPETGEDDEALSETEGSSGVGASDSILKPADQAETGNDDKQEKDPDEENMDALISSGDGSKWVTGSSFRKVWNGIKGAVLVR